MECTICKKDPISGIVSEDGGKTIVCTDCFSTMKRKSKEGATMSKKYTAAEARELDLARGGEGVVKSWDHVRAIRFDKKTLSWRGRDGDVVAFFGSASIADKIWVPATPDPVDTELEAAKKKYEGKLVRLRDGTIMEGAKVYRCQDGRLWMSDSSGTVELHTVELYEPTVPSFCCHTEPPDTCRTVIVKMFGFVDHKAAWSFYRTSSAWGVYGVNDACSAYEFKRRYPDARWCEMPKFEWGKNEN